MTAKDALLLRKGGGIEATGYELPTVCIMQYHLGLGLQKWKRGKYSVSYRMYA